jgi:Phosphotransferase enzyme family
MTGPPAIFQSLNADTVCAALREAGLVLAPSDVRLERREERWAVSLPDDRMAWFAASERGRERLAIERRVLRLLAERCTFRAPRLLFEDAAGYDIRAVVPGGVDPWALYEDIKTDAELARQIGRAAGAILMEQHTRVTRVDVEGWLPASLVWPEPGDWIRARIADVTDDRGLITAVDELLKIYELLIVDPADCVLVHADLGLHNLAIDPATKEVRGVFDYDSAAWADRHHDFRYLALDLPGEPVLEAALAIYEPAVGRRLDRGRIRLYNAVCAASFLASRRGVPADARWCGRTLAQDLEWVRNALCHVAACAT